MAESGIVPSRDQLVAFIEQFVRDDYARSGCPIGGARLADAIRFQFHLVDPARDLGEHWLAGLVQTAENQGKIHRDRSVKHLQVLPPVVPASAVSPSLAPGLYTHPMHVQPDVWRAFVHVSTIGPSYFDRRRSCVLTAAEVSATQNADAVRIDAVPAAVQQSWMSQFLDQSGLGTRQDAPINDAHWWVRFPKWLESISPELDFEWRRFRTKHVVSKVREWAQANDIPVDTILFPFRPPTAASATSTSAFRNPLPAGDDESLRSALVAAISEMPLEDLKRLAIPVHYLLRHLHAR